MAIDVINIIKQYNPNAHARIGIILGSGLGGFIKHISNPVCISYSQLPGFPNLTVFGHEGQLILGSIHGVPIACLQGRAHSYEGNVNEAIKTYIRTLRLLGCDTLLATNAAGSLHVTIGPGELLLVTDHINLQPNNPLVGPNDDDFGPRFYPLDQAYNPDLRKELIKTAEQEKITLHEGVYICVLGPNYETAAEIKAFRNWGADAVGMSTVPEVLVANHCGMKVAVISMITNLATGLASSSHVHENVVKVANDGSEKLNQLILSWIKTFKQ